MVKDNSGFKFYSVVKGKKPGIYDSWSLTEPQVNGYSGALFKGHQTQHEAESFMAQGRIKPPYYYSSSIDNKSASNLQSDSLNSPSQAQLKRRNSTKSTKSATANLSNTANTGSLNSNADTNSNNSHNDKPACDDDEISFPSRNNSSKGPASPEECTNCTKLAQLVATLSDRVTSLEKRLTSSSKQPPEVAQSDDIAKTLQVQLSAIEERLIKNLEMKVTQIQAQSQATYSAAVSKHTVPSSTQNPKLTNALPNAKNHSKATTSIQFQPTKCLVLTDISQENAVKLNQDDIRQAINKQVGPTMIDLVNRYKFNSSNPKFILQLADESAIPAIIENWDPSLFGGSKIRRTIPPKQHVHLGMLKGVPLNMADDHILSDIKINHDISSVYRLRAIDGAHLRTVKVEFETATALQSALNTGILLPSANVLVRVEKPYNSAVNDG